MMEELARHADWRVWIGDWQLLSPAIIALSAWVLIALEHIFPYDRNQKLFRKGWFNDFFLYTLIQSWILSQIMFPFMHWIDRLTGASQLALVSGWPLWVQLLFFLVTHDLYIYWFHRAQHRSAVLWRIHEAHHSPEDVDWLAGSRSHPLEIMINQTVEFLPIIMLGAPPEMILIKGTVDAVWGMYIHANIGVRTGWLQKVINGPEMHRWHHSAVFTGYGFNFATKLAFWDWIFGTAHLPDKEKPPAYGLGEPFPGNYFLQLAYAFRPFRRAGGPAPAE